jgi:hypothetical protein
MFIIFRPFFHHYVSSFLSAPLPLSAVNDYAYSIAYELALQKATNICRSPKLSVPVALPAYRVAQARHCVSAI